MPPRSANWATTSTWPGSWAARPGRQGHDLVSTIAAFVKEYGITHIILGRSRQPWYRRWFSQSVLDRLQQIVDGRRHDGAWQQGTTRIEFAVDELKPPFSAWTCRPCDFAGEP